MSFKELRDIEIEYRSLSDNIVDSFYIPCLEKVRVYKRASGFFSSSILVQISKGLCSMAKRRAKMKLLISPRLDEKDYEAIQKGYDLRELIANKFDKEYTDPTSIEDKDRFALLSYLISEGLLDIRVVVLEKNNDSAMYHEKMGIMIDYEDNTVAFAGSPNESYTGYNLNYESIDVFCSWKSPDAEMRCGKKEMAFNRLWDGTEKGTMVLKFPDIIKNKILAYKVEDKERIFKLDDNFREKFLLSKAKEQTPSTDAINFHDYQKDAINEWKLQKYKGIFDMATGTGKTFTGAGAICKLYQDKKRVFAIVCCPYVHLVDQWVDELKIFNINAIKCYGRINYETNLDRALIKFKQRRISFVCVVTTNSTFMKSTMQEMIKKNLEETLLIVDEAHNFGADKTSSYLNLEYPYRLALSATLERYGDEKGTQKLYDFFGNKCITYTLEQAIREDKLTKYKYYPIIINLNEDELSEYIDLTNKIRKFRGSGGSSDDLPDGLKRLLIKRARLIAGAQNKVTKLLSILKGETKPDGTYKTYTKDNNILIYCGAVKYGQFGYEDEESDEKKQIQLVIEKLKKELGMVVSKFTSDEDAQQRESIKSAFKDEELQALVAIKCLDEGMNIPAIKTAFILASSTNPKEYIQRRGRVLRKYPGKEYAEIYDFITISRPLEDLKDLSNEHKSLEISLVEKELVRLLDFARLSLNPAYSNKIVDEIKDAYGINIINEGVNEYE